MKGHELHAGGSSISMTSTAAGSQVGGASEIDDIANHPVDAELRTHPARSTGSSQSVRPR
jgi:hypothetical protein